HRHPFVRVKPALHLLAQRIGIAETLLGQRLADHRHETTLIRILLAEVASAFDRNPHSLKVARAGHAEVGIWRTVDIDRPGASHCVISVGTIRTRRQPHDPGHMRYAWHGRELRKELTKLPNHALR